MSVVLLIVLAVLAASARPMQRAERERRDALMRRIGWGYGYGAGYVDAQRGREYDLAPPRDGYTR